MNQTRANYQQFINDIYTSQKHILGLVTKLGQRMDDLEARLRAIKDAQNLHLSAIKNSLDELRSEIRHQYTEEAEEIDELNDVLAGELENLNIISTDNTYLDTHFNNVSSNNTPPTHNNITDTSLYNGEIINLKNLINDTPSNNTYEEEPLIL